MIGNFARLMRGPPRIVESEEAARDAPPERFTQKISDEGGDVYVAPMLEALRAALARARASERSERAGASTVATSGGGREERSQKEQASDDPSTGAPEEETPASGTEARP